MVLLLGVDDAGRGPVIGPMVLAGCLIDEKIEAEFKKLGVRDSKQLTQLRREFLEEQIKTKALDFHTVLLTPAEIDEGSKSETMGLNELEAIAMAKVINKLNKGKEKIKVVVDCPSNSIKKWSDFLKMQIDNLSNLEISCEHKADQNHVSVSAASILAKCQREKEMDRIKKEFGPEVGSGYTSDPLTQKFVAKNAASTKHGKIFRKSWSTWQKARGLDGQKKLF